MLNTLVHEKWFPNHTIVADSEVEIEEQKQVIKSTLQVVPLSLSTRDFKIQDATTSRTRWLINGLGLLRTPSFEREK